MIAREQIIKIIHPEYGFVDKFPCCKKAVEQVDAILALVQPEIEQARKEERERIDFAKRLAKVMDDLKSSHVYFILQQAYPENEDWEWDEFQKLIYRIMEAKA